MQSRLITPLFLIAFIAAIGTRPDQQNPSKTPVTISKAPATPKQK